MNRSRLAGVALIFILVALALLTELDASSSSVSWAPIAVAALVGIGTALAIHFADRRWYLGRHLNGRRVWWTAICVVVVFATVVPMALEQTPTQFVVVVVAFIGGVILTLPVLYRQHQGRNDSAPGQGVDF